MTVASVFGAPLLSFPGSMVLALSFLDLPFLHEFKDFFMEAVLGQEVVVRAHSPVEVLHPHTEHSSVHGAGLPPAELREG